MKKANGPPATPPGAAAGARRTDGELPAELRQALAADPAGRAAYERLPPSHRLEYARWVAEAKKELTRRRRAARALEMLRAGKPPE
jgi:uncharacterized protein YdeI (YjbR/CyaY-like superfamily)